MMIARPWYSTKTMPSLIDAVSAFHKAMCTTRITDEVG